jgi:dihydroorotase
MYDLIIRGGLLVDPSQGIHAHKSVAIHQGKVVQIGDNADALPGRDAWQVIDASGRIVTPGLVDMHLHARPESVRQHPFNRDTFWSISLDPDRVLGTGVTTAVDAGSYGVDNFSLAFLPMAETSRPGVLAFINPLPFGLADRAERGPGDADVSRLVDVYERNQDYIVGIKVLLSKRYWHSWGTPLDYLDVARRVADETALPIMVHGIRTDQRKWLKGITFKDILGRLKAGDIVSHCFCQYKSFVSWKAVEEIREAVEKGVVLDVGHGTGSFSFDVAEKAMALGLPPTTISSDLHHCNYTGPVYDLPTTMSKFLLLGMSLDEVVERTTVAPARVIGMADSLGTLRAGAAADAVIFDLVEGEFAFEDSYGNERSGHARLTPRAVIRGGIVYLGSTWRDVGWIAGGPLMPPDKLGDDS